MIKNLYKEMQIHAIQKHLTLWRIMVKKTSHVFSANLHERMLVISLNQEILYSKLTK